MRDTERFYFEHYKQTQDVRPEECYMGGKNCYSCSHCRVYDGKFHEFQHEYCLMAKRDADD